MSACSFSTLRLNLVLTHGIPPDVHGGVHIFLPPIGSVQSLSGHAVAYRWRSLPRVRWHKVSIVLKVARVTGACLLCITMDQLLLCASLSPHPLLVESEYVQIQNMDTTTAVLAVSWIRFPPREDCCIVQVTCKTVASRFSLTHSGVRVPWFSLQIRVSCTPTEP